MLVTLAESEALATVNRQGVKEACCYFFECLTVIQHAANASVTVHVVSLPCQGNPRYKGLSKTMLFNIGQGLAWCILLIKLV